MADVGNYVVIRFTVTTYKNLELCEFRHYKSYRDIVCF